MRDPVLVFNESPAGNDVAEYDVGEPLAVIWNEKLPPLPTA